MKHIKTLNTKSLQNTVKKGGCGECQTSCQSACKTSCTVGNRELRKHKIIFIMKYMPGSGLEAAACFLWLCIRGEKIHR